MQRQWRSPLRSVISCRCTPLPLTVPGRSAVLELQLDLKQDWLLRKLLCSVSRKSFTFALIVTFFQSVRLTAVLRCACAALVIHEAVQAVTTATSPFSWGFEVLWLASFLALPVLVAATCLPLALLPVWDTLSAGRVRIPLPSLSCISDILRSSLMERYETTLHLNNKQLVYGAGVGSCR